MASEGSDSFDPLLLRLVAFVAVLVVHVLPERADVLQNLGSRVLPEQDVEQRDPVAGGALALEKNVKEVIA